MGGASKKIPAFRWFGAFLFTVLVPGTVTVVLPYYVLDRSFSVAAISWTPVAVLGLVVLALGVTIYLRCLWDFVRRGRGLPSPIDHPKQVVISGLYRYVRNPMYLGVLAILVGEILVVGSIRLLAYAGAWLLVVHTVILVYEEPNLRARFGEEYSDYCRNVRRWIPGRPRTGVPGDSP